MEFQSRNFQRLATMLERYRGIADRVLKDDEEVEKIVTEAESKAQKSATQVAQLLETLTWFIRLLRSYLKKEYTKVPWRSLVMILAAVIYFVNPMDVVPDFIAGIGYLDDATVLALVFRNVKKDVEAFKEWYRQNNNDY